MLRINLLPDYVKQRRQVKQVIAGFAIAAIACVVLPLGFYFYQIGQLKTLRAKADAAVIGKGKTDASKALAASTLAQVAPIKALIDYVTAVHVHIGNQIQFYNTLADVTPRNSLIYSGTTFGAATGAAGGGYPGSGAAGAAVAATGPTSVSIKAYSGSVATVGRYLQAMYREPDFTTVAVDKVPGYPDNVRNLYYYGKTLVFADDATGTGGGTGGSGGYPGASSSSYPGSGGRPGGGYPTGGGGTGANAGANGPADYTTASLGPNAPGNVPAGVGPPPPELTGGVSVNGGTGPGGTPSGLPGRQPTGQQNGQVGATGTAAVIYGAVFDRVAGSNISPFASPEVRQSILRARLRRVVKKTVPRGFDLTVTATLKADTTKSLTAPVLPGTVPAATTGAPSGFPGGPSGSPGGPPPPPGARQTG